MAGKKEFTYREVVILVLSIVAAFSFLHTAASDPIWSLKFLREFLVNFIFGIVVAAVVAIIIGVIKGD